MNDGLSEGFLFMQYQRNAKIVVQCKSSGHKRTGKVGSPVVNDAMLRQHKITVMDRKT